jgi:hypothetical protein
MGRAVMRITEAGSASWIPQLENTGFSARFSVPIFGAKTRTRVFSLGDLAYNHLLHSTPVAAGAIVSLDSGADLQSPQIQA